MQIVFSITLVRHPVQETTGEPTEFFWWHVRYNYHPIGVILNFCLTFEWNFFNLAIMSLVYIDFWGNVLQFYILITATCLMWLMHYWAIYKMSTSKVTIIKTWVLFIILVLSCMIIYSWVASSACIAILVAIMIFVSYPLQYILFWVTTVFVQPNC